MVDVHDAGMTRKQVWAAGITILLCAALLPLGVRVAQVQRHKVLLGNIFSEAYAYRSEHRAWPHDLRFLSRRYPDEAAFVSAHWGGTYQAFDQVLTLNPENPGAILFDTVWKLSVDENGFVRDGENK